MFKAPIPVLHVSSASALLISCSMFFLSTASSGLKKRCAKPTRATIEEKFGKSVKCRDNAKPEVECFGNDDLLQAEFTAEGVAKKIYFWTGCNGLWTLQKFLDRIIPTNTRGKVRRRSENPSGCQTRIVEEYDCLTMEFFQENCMGCAPASIIVTWK